MMVWGGGGDGGEGGAGRAGFAGADLAGDHAEGFFGDGPGDPGGGFGVGGVAVQHGGGEVAAEGHLGEAEVLLQAVDHRWSCPVRVPGGWVRPGWPAGGAAPSR